MRDEQGLDINVAGDFLVMAATLMEIKNAMLLPKGRRRRAEEASAAAELADPRYELVQQLLEYKKLKDSATLLERQQQQQEGRFPQHSPPSSRRRSDEPPPVDLDEVQIWDLLTPSAR